MAWGFLLPNQGQLLNPSNPAYYQRAAGTFIDSMMHAVTRSENTPSWSLDKLTLYNPVPYLLKPDALDPTIFGQASTDTIPLDISDIFRPGDHYVGTATFNVGPDLQSSMVVHATYTC